MRVNDFPANEICTVYDVTVSYPEYGVYHFEAVVGEFADEKVGPWRKFITSKEMDFEGDIPNIFPGQSIFLKN